MKKKAYYWLINMVCLTGWMNLEHKSSARAIHTTTGVRTYNLPNSAKLIFGDDKSKISVQEISFSGYFSSKYPGLGPTLSIQNHQSSGDQKLSYRNTLVGLEKKFSDTNKNSLFIPTATFRYNFISIGSVQSRQESERSPYKKNFHFKSPGLSVDAGIDIKLSKNLTLATLAGVGFENFKLENGSVEYQEILNGKKMYVSIRGEKYFGKKNKFDYISSRIAAGITWKF